MRYHNATAAEFHFVNRMLAFFAAGTMNDASGAAYVIDHVLEKTQHAMLGDLTRRMNDVRLDDGGSGFVEFQNRGAR
jgi:hypothetical protein